MSTDTTRPTAATLYQEKKTVHTLKWMGARDNVGVSRYEVWRDDGNIWLAGLPASVTSWQIPDDLAAVQHSYRVVTYDLAGNHANSNIIVAGGEMEPTPEPAPVELPPMAGQPILDEQFSGLTLDTTKWSPYTSPGNHSRYPGLRKPSALQVADGKLIITATYDPVGKIITSGAMAHRVDWAYGDVEVRVRTDVDPTFQMSGVVLRWPYNSMIEGEGEYDFYETTRAADQLLRAFYHYAGTQNLQRSYRHNTAKRQDWHTIRWSARQEAIRLFIDGKLEWTITDPEVLKNLPRKGHVCIQLDTFGINGYVPLPAPVKMEVDYVKVSAL